MKQITLLALLLLTIVPTSTFALKLPSKEALKNRVNGTIKSGANAGETAVNSADKAAAPVEEKAKTAAQAGASKEVVAEKAAEKGEDIANKGTKKASDAKAAGKEIKGILEKLK